MKIITDKNKALTAVKRDNWTLQFASKELRNDREVVLEAFKRNNEALDYASEELRKEIRQKTQQFINNLK